MKTSVVSLGAIALFAGCQTYTPHPVNLAEELRQWQASSRPEAPGLTLTLAQAKVLALTLNPGLNLKRLEAAKTLAGARQAGWWKDPEFDADALRVLKNVPDPWILGSTLQFTLPVSGVPDLEKQAAGRMAEADRLAVVAAEQQLQAEVEQAWIRLAHQEHKLQAAEAFLKRLDATCAKLGELQAHGEISRIDLGVFLLERQSRQLERQRLAASQREGRGWQLDRLLPVDIVSVAPRRGWPSGRRPEGTRRCLEGRRRCGFSYCVLLGNGRCRASWARRFSRSRASIVYAFYSVC